MVGAMSDSGIKTALNFEGTLTTEIFLYFLQHFLCPLLKAGDVVIMDNASVHKHDDFTICFKAVQMKNIFCYIQTNYFTIHLGLLIVPLFYLGAL
jgi:hypothetical protein